MAALIPAIGTCVSNMTGGERRFANRLEQKLEDDWLLWYDVPLGPRNVHPDFVVFNPRRGLLMLEVKDWKLDTIRDIDRQKNRAWPLLLLQPLLRFLLRFCEGVGVVGDETIRL